MIQRDASLSNSYTSDPRCFTNQDYGDAGVPTDISAPIYLLNRDICYKNAPIYYNISKQKTLRQG